jgi:transglutaminase-like putative cysteine protease
MTRTTDAAACLRPTACIDSDAPAVVAFAHEACGDATDDVERAIRLYYAVRDRIVYTPYCDFRSDATYRASAVLAKGSGFCVGKAALLAAVARAVVRNHLCTPRLRALMGTDLFYYHGYTELYLRGRWVKATPAFDRGLCDRFGVHALEFDGATDSLFQPHDRSGRRHMEYVRDRGPHADVPVADIIDAFERGYPNFMRADTAPATQFRNEAEQTWGE